MHMDHAQPQPSGDYRTAMAASWTGHLRAAGVPWHEVPELYEQAIRARSRAKGRNFMPVVEDLLHAWESAVEDGYWDQQNEEPDYDLPALPPGQNPLPGGINTDRAPAYVRAFAQMGHVTCFCPEHRFGRPSAELISEGAAGFFWVCREDKCALRQPAVATKPAPMATPVPRDYSPAAVEVEWMPREGEVLGEELMSDAEILDALDTRCGFGLELCSEAEAVAFGKFLLRQAPVATWSRAIIGPQWAKWSERVETRR